MLLTADDTVVKQFSQNQFQRALIIENHLYMGQFILTSGTVGMPHLQIHPNSHGQHLSTEIISVQFLDVWHQFHHQVKQLVTICIDFGIL